MRLTDKQRDALLAKVEEIRRRALRSLVLSQQAQNDLAELNESLRELQSDVRLVEATPTNEP